MACIRQAEVVQSSFAAQTAWELELDFDIIKGGGKLLRGRITRMTKYNKPEAHSDDSMVEALEKPAD